jgi:hypothetical protein
MSGDADKPKEPAWLTRLAQVGSTATLQKQQREKRTGSLGAASVGKNLMAWTCQCGWSGSSRELKVGGSGVCCPVCGGSPQKA